MSEVIACDSDGNVDWTRIDIFVYTDITTSKGPHICKGKKIRVLYIYIYTHICKE